MKKILITGGTGMIGSRLAEKLTEKEYEVRILSRSKNKGFYWNPEDKFIDEEVFDNLDVIFHLAGAPISKRWTKSYKKEIYDSRIGGASLIYEYCQKLNFKPKVFISASGVNYYGTETTDKIFKETDPAANDYLGKLSLEWENAAFQFEELGTRVCTVRTPAVLSERGGMLKELKPMIKMNLISPMGNGRQIVPWAHIDDLADAYIFLMENAETSGAYNVVANEVTDSKKFTQKLVKAYGKRVLLPNAPAFALKLVLGEMSSLLLKGSAISNRKIKDAGFKFSYHELGAAMKDLAK